MASIAITAAVGTALSAAGTAYESHEQGVAVANEDKAKARVEADDETGKQINMRENMLRALASQNAAAGALGGSVSRANTMRQITQNQNDLMVSQANSSAQVSLLDQAAANAESAGNVGAGIDAVGGVSSTISNYQKTASFMNNS
jgi:hypothetical protein